MDAEYSLNAKKVELCVLEAEVQSEELWSSDEYQCITQQVAELKGWIETDEVDTTDDQPGDLVMENTGQK